MAISEASCHCFKNSEAVQLSIFSNQKRLKELVFGYNDERRTGIKAPDYIVNPIIAQLNGNERIVAFYNCAFRKKILLQGYLFVTTTHLRFFSFFNDDDFGTFLGSFFGLGRDD